MSNDLTLLDLAALPPLTPVVGYVTFKAHGTQRLHFNIRHAACLLTDPNSSTPDGCFIPPLPWPRPLCGVCYSDHYEEPDDDC